MAEYQLTSNDIVLRISDNTYIPDHPANRDRAAYNEWLAAGGVPDPYVPPPEPPPIINPNERLDDGIAAALMTALSVRNGLHALPLTFNATNFQQFLVHARTLSDAFVAMLQAQAVPVKPDKPELPDKPTKRPRAVRKDLDHGGA